jgi:hypothetical protein
VTRDEHARDDRAGGDRRASDVARDRLGADLSSEMAATRAAWTDALLRSDAALRHGRPEEARRALDDQRLLLVQLQRRLDRAVSSALVEREAEYALQDGGPGLAALVRTPDGADPQDEATPGAPGAVEIAPGGAADDRRRLRRLPRALSGATAAAVVGVVALLLGSAPPPTPEITAMDERSPVEEVPPEVLALEIDDEASGLSSPPADELRGLAALAPRWQREDVEPEPRPEQVEEVAEPVPAEEADDVPDEVADTSASDGQDARDEEPRRRDPDATSRDDEETPDEGEAVDPDEDEDEDGDGDAEGLTERLRDPLPRVDQSIAERLEKHIEGLRGE